MVCEKCSNWKCEELSFEEVNCLWRQLIDGEITPGISKRYRREAAKQGLEISEIRIGFKYCTEGVLTRFYIRRGVGDYKPMLKMLECQKFSENSIKMERSSSMWHICAVESHGPSEVNGICFTPGLFENDTYMRIPLYGSVKPMIERGESVCSVCGKDTNKSIKIVIEKSFCCNKHYLEWWAKRYREEVSRFNG